MTHAQLYATWPTIGLQPSDCSGDLVTEYIRPDPILTDGVTVNHLVAVARCVECRRRVSFDSTSGKIRNEFPGL